MTHKTTRRTFLGGAIAVGAARLLTLRVSPSPAAAPAAAREPRVEQLRALSRDAKGAVHVDRAAFIGADGVATGTLPVTAAESRELLLALVLGDFTRFQERGVHLGGNKYVFIRDAEEGTVIHAIRPGEFLTVRATPDLVVVATATTPMIHNRAVEAVYRVLDKPTPAPRNA